MDINSQPINSIKIESEQYFRSLFEKLSNRVWPAKQNHLDMKYDVSDLVIPSEEYADYNLNQYIDKNLQFIRDVDSLSLEQQKLALSESQNTNPLIDQAKKNLQKLKPQSLSAILKSSKCHLKSKSLYLEETQDPNLKLAIESTVYPVEKNSLRPELIAGTEFDPFSKDFDCFIQVSIFSSISKKKISELLVRSDCRVFELFDQVECQVAKIDECKYNRFFCLEDILIGECDPSKKNLNIDFVFKRMKMFKKDFESTSDQNLTIGELKVILDKTYIFRDNIGCDHMIIFTDILFGKLASENADEKIIQIFFPIFASRLCEICCENKAAFICKNAEINHLKINFLCTQCNFDLNEGFNSANLSKIFERIEFCYEEK